jgi:hypothetical protein
MSTTQLSFTPLRLTIAAPVIGPETVRAILQCGEEDVYELCQDGTIEWAWDLRTPGADHVFLRALAQSVDAAKRKLAGEKIPLSLETDAEILHAILNHDRDIIRGTEIARRFNFGADHCNRLIRAGALLTIKPASEYDVNESPVVTRESLAAFLTARRIA